MWPAWMVIFLMTFVPMFGATIGGGVVALLLLLYSWPAALIYLIFFIIEQQIENNLIQPKIQSKRLNMSALIILIAVIVGLQVAGILGALVAIPLAGCAVVLMRDALRTRRVRTAAESGRTIDPDNDEGDISIVFTEEQRKFIKPNLPKIKRKRSK
jgi:predicted PurR-regulated permease PerM